MREIKFRAWVNDSYMAIQGMPDLETFQSFMFHYCDQKIVMQFTGLKDKTGKEIYEGDILKEWLEDLVLEENGFWWYGIVSFKNGQWKVLQADFKYLNFDDMSKLYEDFENLEVVGNIYENPELLTLNS